MRPPGSTTMRRGAAMVAAVALCAVSGCVSLRGYESIGGYVDDAAITASVRSRMVEDKAVDADAIKVETENGNVMLSGFARNPIERLTAESIAMKVRGVKSVQNNLALQP
jgi:hyperosmotically inducible periplasmic protein